MIGVVYLLLGALLTAGGFFGAYFIFKVEPKKAVAEKKKKSDIPQYKMIKTNPGNQLAQTKVRENIPIQRYGRIEEGEE